MEFNDGSQYRVLTNLDTYLAAGRDLYAYRAASKRSGSLYMDTAFEHHRALTGDGRLRGTVIYQFAYADQSPESQAAFFLDCLEYGLQAHEMVCLDVEPGAGFTTGNVSVFARSWLAAVEPILSTRAWVYVPGALSTALSASLTGERIIWAPRYSGTASRGAEPTWRHDVHQYTDRGFFPGCSASGDTSYTTLTTETMLRRCNPSGIPTPCGA